MIGGNIGSASMTWNDDWPSVERTDAAAFNPMADSASAPSKASNAIFRLSMIALLLARAVVARYRLATADWQSTSDARAVTVVIAAIKLDTEGRERSQEGFGVKFRIGFGQPGLRN